MPGVDGDSSQFLEASSIRIVLGLVEELHDPPVSSIGRLAAGVGL
jgi:hypothetical protein